MRLHKRLKIYFHKKLSKSNPASRFVVRRPCRRAADWQPFFAAYRGCEWPLGKCATRCQPALFLCSAFIYRKVSN